MYSVHIINPELQCLMSRRRIEIKIDFHSTQDSTYVILVLRQITVKRAKYAEDELRNFRFR